MRALLDLQHLIHTVHMVNESIGNSVHVALDLGLASKAITAMSPTDAHRPMLLRRSLQFLSGIL